ncbi:DUF4062 domain-containing protein [Massilia sp. RP-1-19]|uniref:DUF4062 domain-containing protein n=1 Tax=Massilia polaris TaxID=2728846 RepID=A0A848HQ89_9BURK|nr:DUF4062 domain-containing protein [Massilia polaris]NML63522.1 DUF4062 domain-containing protein [Massilia polaris]
MAAPKVFVSSTCFDLSEVREQLTRFILSYGFDPVLSENGDVFYKPDCHTHESCLHEVANCQLFILIIGGRFGGEYIADRTKSITNAEYAAARQCNIPIFTYVRSGVLANHHLYQQNRKKAFVSDIEYPAIEKQEYALDIFRFVDDVRKSPANNALEGFVNFQHIESHLRKQWAGMFFELLRSRELTAQMDVTNHLISGVRASNQKLEELIKSLYISSNKVTAEKEIASIEAVSEIEVFFETVLHPDWIKEGKYLLDSARVDLTAISHIAPADLTWHQYLVTTGLFEYDEIPIDPADDDSDFEIALKCMVTVESNSYFMIGIDRRENGMTPEWFERGVRSSTPEQREKALSRIFDKYAASSSKKPRRKLPNLTSAGRNE